MLGCAVPGGGERAEGGGQNKEVPREGHPDSALQAGPVELHENKTKENLLFAFHFFQAVSFEYMVIK